jgi:hypothetical protein
MAQLQVNSLSRFLLGKHANVLRTIPLIGLLCASVMLLSCGDEPPAPVGPPARNLVSVSVDPTSAEATAPTGTSPFSATGTFDQAPTTEENLTVQWASSDPTIATVDSASGLATCIAEGGPVTITASSGKKSGTAQLTCVIASQPGSSGNCVYRCAMVRCGALTGYCSISSGNQCKQVSRPGACPPGRPAGGSGTDSCGVSIDTSRSCSE